MSCSSSCSSCSTIDDDPLDRSLLPSSPPSSDDSSSSHILSPSILQQLEQRLLKALRSYSVPISFDSAASSSTAPPPPSLPLPSFEEDFHFICHHLCNDSASSFNVFLELFDSLGIKEFFRVVHRLIQLNIYSHLIAWSYQFANDDPQRFYWIIIGQQSQSKGKIIKKNNESINVNSTTTNNNNNNNNNEGMGEDDLQLTRTKLIGYINKEAAIYECFPSHGKLPRAKPFPSVETNNDTKDTTTTTAINNNNTTNNDNNNNNTINNEQNHSSSSEGTNGELDIDDSSKDWEHIQLDENKNVIFSDEIKEKEKEKLMNAPQPSASHCSNHLESISLTEQEVEALSTDIANAVQIPMMALSDRVTMYGAIFVLLIAIFIAYFFMAN